MAHGINDHHSIQFHGVIEFLLMSVVKNLCRWDPVDQLTNIYRRAQTDNPCVVYIYCVCVMSTQAVRMFHVECLEKE